MPVIDIAPWLAGNRLVAAEVDAALQDVGFFLITGHGVPATARAALREAARQFFALPQQVKQRYAVTVAGRGWLPPGVEANGYAEGTATPPDLKESYSVGADSRTAGLDGYWFQDNLFPTEIPALEQAVTDYLALMKSLSDELLRLCAAALCRSDDFFTRHTAHATHTMNINWYPPIAATGAPEQGRTGSARTPTSARSPCWTVNQARAVCRCGPSPTAGRTRPFVPDAFTINTGDLLARWSGDRWKSNRHRVLPPAGKPNNYAPVVSSAFLRERLDAITVG